MMYLHSISAYVDEIVDQIDAGSITILKETKFNELIKFHHGWGTSIRNKCGLWKPDHPLTANWHAHPENHKMIDGCDCSEDHPDAVSMKIMEGVWKKVTA